MMFYQKYSLPESPTSETHRLLCQDKTLATSYFFQRDPICGQIKYFCKESLIICLDPINIYSVFKTFKVSLFTMPCCSSIRDAASCGSRFSIISMHSYGSLHAYQKLTKAAQVQGNSISVLEMLSRRGWMDRWTNNWRILTRKQTLNTI